VVEAVAALPQRVLPVVSIAGLVTLSLSVALLALFLIHQLTIWISLDPERAFENSKSLVQLYESGYDTTANLWNAFNEVLLVALPAWNSVVMYAVQPLVFVVVDVLSLAFTRRPYEGVITEAAVPYKGYRCPEDGSTTGAAEFCGLASFYADALGMGADYGAGGAPVADVAAGRVANASILLLSTATARRLTEASTDGEPIVGALDLSALADALHSLLSTGIVLMGTLSDVVFHAIFVVASELFTLLWQLIMLFTESIAGVAMMIFRTEGRRKLSAELGGFAGGGGVASGILKKGIDLLLILAVDVLLPIPIVILNAVMCALDLLFPAGWDEQLDCVEKACFMPGSDVPGDIYHTFLSIDPIMDQIALVFEKLMNPTTGKRFGGAASGPVENDGPSVRPATRATPRTQACGECFHCKVKRHAHTRTRAHAHTRTRARTSHFSTPLSGQVPELRAIFMLVATVYGCALDANQYGGRVEDSCLDGGKGYEALCGPRTMSTRLLTDAQWREAFPAHRDFDADLAQSYAGRFRGLADEEGGAGSLGAPAQTIANAWFERDISLGDDQAARFVRLVCEQMRAETAAHGDPRDGSPFHEDFEPGSMAQLTRGYLYESCARCTSAHQHISTSAPLRRAQVQEDVCDQDVPRRRGPARGRRVLRGGELPQEPAALPARPRALPRQLRRRRPRQAHARLCHNRRQAGALGARARQRGARARPRQLHAGRPHRRGAALRRGRGLSALQRPHRGPRRHARHRRGRVQARAARVRGHPEGAREGTHPGIRHHHRAVPSRLQPLRPEPAAAARAAAAADFLRAAFAPPTAAAARAAAAVVCGH